MFLKYFFTAIIGIFTLGCFGYEFPSLTNLWRQVKNENFISKTNFDEGIFSKESKNNFSTSTYENDINKYENDTFFWMIQKTSEAISAFKNNNNKTLDDNVTDNVTEKVFNELLNDMKIKFENATLLEEITTISQDSLENENYDFYATEATLQETYETMFLARNNCNLEIFISNFDVTKIHFKFESLKNYSAGSCCIILNGSQNTKLAIIITDIFLAKATKNENEAETLNVISINHGKDFVLKKYIENQMNQSVLLSESSKVFVLLQYNVTTIVTENFNTRFNLEAFNYEKKNLHWSI